MPDVVDVAVTEWQHNKSTPSVLAIYNPCLSFNGCVARLSAYCFHVCPLQQAHIKCVCNCSLLFSLSNIQTLFSWKKTIQKPVSGGL